MAQRVDKFFEYCMTIAKEFESSMEDPIVKTVRRLDLSYAPLFYKHGFAI